MRKLPALTLSVAVLCAVIGGCPIRSNDIETAISVVDEICGPSETPTATAVESPSRAVPSATETPAIAPTAILIDTAPTATLTPEPATATSTPVVVATGVVRWLHGDISTWPETVTLRVRFMGNDIVLDTDEVRPWPGRRVDSGAIVNANAWVCVPLPDATYCGTWEYLRSDPYQEAKPKSKVEGGHIKRPPLDRWTPQRGDRLGFLVSCIARDPRFANCRQRSNTVWVTWP